MIRSTLPISFENTDIYESVDHVMKQANNETLIWVPADHAGDDEKQQNKFHWPYIKQLLPTTSTTSYRVFGS